MNTFESEPSLQRISELQVERVAKPRHFFRPAWLVALLAMLVIGSATLLAWLPNWSPALSPIPSATPYQSPSRQPKVTWSQNQLEIILLPGESTTRDLTFTSDQNVQNIVIEPVSELAPFVSIQPNSLANVPAGQSQFVRLMFSIPANATLGTSDGTIHVRSASHTLPQTLKTSVTAVPSTAEDTLAYLADQIATGHVETALKFLSPSPVNRHVLETLDQSQRQELANKFRNAQLISEVENVRYYHSPSGASITMLHTGDGRWVIVNW